MLEKERDDFLTGIVLTVWGLCWYNFLECYLGGPCTVLLLSPGPLCEKGCVVADRQVTLLTSVELFATCNSPQQVDWDLLAEHQLAFPR